MTSITLRQRGKYHLYHNAVEKGFEPASDEIIFNIFISGQMTTKATTTKVYSFSIFSFCGMNPVLLSKHHNGSVIFVIRLDT